jgi:hypothetical protein
MPLTDESILQENSGATSAQSTTIAPSLQAGTTAGSTVLVVIVGGISFSAVPTGFVLVEEVARSSSSAIRLYRKDSVAAAETSWTWTAVANSGFAWWAAEATDIAQDATFNVSAELDNGTTITDGATRSTGTTSPTYAQQTMALAFHGSYLSTTSSLQTGTWGSHTNDFVEVANQRSTVSGTGQQAGLSVSRKFLSTSATLECTATITGPSASEVGWGMVVALAAADSPVTLPLVFHTGFEYGTHGGLGAGGAVGAPKLADNATGTFGTGYLVQAGSARNGSYGLRVVQAGAAAYVQWSAGTGASFPLSQNTAVAGFSVKAVSSTGVVVLAELQPNVGTICQVVYDTTTSKIGVRWGSGGTVSYQSGTTAVGAWAWVDVRTTGWKTTTWHVDWQVEEGGVLTAQASPADLTGQTASVFSAFRLGGNLAQTVTADFDDLCLSNFAGAWPLTIHKVLGLTVDTGATPTLTGTSTNFSVFTANTTLAAWNATNARNAVDEVPPTISASSDGVCQTAVAASDYIEFPMAPPTLSDTEIITAVCMEAAMWGGTGSGSGTIGLRGWDGTTETVLLPTSVSWDPDSLTTPSATVPPWVRYQWNRVGGWTKTALDAACVRFGFSSDATPDMGMHVVYLEAAIRQAQAATVIGESGSVALEANVNPYTTGVRSLVTTTPSDQGTTLNWTDAGGPHTQPVAAASTDTQTLDAEAGEVTFQELVSENELPDRE